MEFGEMKRNTSNWSNFCMLLRRAGLTASAGLSCLCVHFLSADKCHVYPANPAYEVNCFWRPNVMHMVRISCLVCGNMSAAVYHTTYKNYTFIKLSMPLGKSSLIIYGGYRYEMLLSLGAERQMNRWSSCFLLYNGLHYVYVLCSKIC